MPISFAVMCVPCGAHILQIIDAVNQVIEVHSSLPRRRYALSLGGLCRTYGLVPPYCYPTHLPCRGIEYSGCDRKSRMLSAGVCFYLFFPYRYYILFTHCCLFILLRLLRLPRQRQVAFMLTSPYQDYRYAKSYSHKANPMVSGECLLPAVVGFGVVIQSPRVNPVTQNPCANYA